MYGCVSVSVGEGEGFFPKWLTAGDGGYGVFMPSILLKKPPVEINKGIRSLLGAICLSWSVQFLIWLWRNISIYPCGMNSDTTIKYQGCPLLWQLHIIHVQNVHVFYHVLNYLLWCTRWQYLASFIDFIHWFHCVTVRYIPGWQRIKGEIRTRMEGSGIAIYTDSAARNHSTREWVSQRVILLSFCVTAAKDITCFL